MHRSLAVMGLMSAGILATPSIGSAQEQDACELVRMSDLGWTDIALTNATAQVLLESLGYQVEQTMLSLDVTYLMLKDAQIDVFLGNWRPVQDEQFASYFDNGSVVPLATNLEGAKYTLAVPDYVAEAGVTDFADLAGFTDKFDGRIYGIEPGTNQPLLDMIAADRHGLGEWEVVESSEAAMLSQVRRTVAKDEWIVFLGWQPHPMNLSFDMTYLAGGDEEFGPNFGGATVRTIARGEYKTDCPNVAALFENLVFDVAYENEGMELISGDGLSPREAAVKMIGTYPERLDAWLDGVSTRDGDAGLQAVRDQLEL